MKPKEIEKTLEARLVREIEVVEFLGLDKADVEWYEVEEEKE